MSNKKLYNQTKIILIFKAPIYALEALAKKENVTLAILCEEFDILIPSEDAVADAGSTQFYTIDDLVEMYE